MKAYRKNSLMVTIEGEKVGEYERNKTGINFIPLPEGLSSVVKYKGIGA